MPTTNTPTPETPEKRPEPIGETALRLTAVSKSFPGVRALSDIELEVRAGTVHALVGENGSGKSTLVKVACGALRPDAGSIQIGGRDLAHPSPLAARKLGLAAAYQDTSLVPDLSVLDNVLLSFTGTSGYSRLLRPQRARALLEPYDLQIPLEAPVGSLTPGARQIVEVVRALVHKPRVLLLDEPTATLDADSIDRLEALVRTAREDGTAILYISHRLEEVQRLADEVTVLRDGEIQGSYPGGNWSVPEIVALMVGAPIDLTFPAKADKSDPGSEALRVAGLKGARFGPIDLTVRQGEIVGIAGAEGNGQRDLVRALVGLAPAEGRIDVSGEPVSVTNPGSALAHGVRFLSGDRVAESIFSDMSVMGNSTLPVIGRMCRGGLIQRARERRAYGEAAARLGIIAATPDQPVRDLSGGNQQKTVLSRALHDPAKVLVIDEPTQGVDARSRIDIYQALRGQANEGRGVLINSSDALELAGLCDRVYVVSRGMITEELDGQRLDESNIVHGFVSTGGRDVRQAEEVGSPTRQRVASIVGRPWFPLAALLLMIVAVGAYTTARSPIFIQQLNLNALLALSLPLIVVAFGQQVALLARGFDISVGAMMSLTVVFASFSISSESLTSIIPGVLLVLALGVAVGLANGLIVRVLNVNAIIATIGMLGILSGIALIRRPQPGGVISSQLESILVQPQIGFIPISFVVLLALAVAGQFVLMRTGVGLTLRASGFDEVSSHRLGVRVTPIKICAFIACSVLAAVAGLFLAAQTGVGSADIGDGYALPSIAACVIGGASLGGGRGSFVGCVLAAVFLTLLVNIAPLLQLSPSYSDLITGVLTLLAVVAYTLNRRAAAPN